ncbi:putative E3 ubiquitin-protein ligase HECTD1 [Paratrimastix pyriformis]|uniref:E3 ubiquitin-protein ligase HECTD1 n=1 Tax=Paratrimastix pyriformis TaxID=342808 RepID=A0ABQ8UR21_9EUKA|nr:putative E3 ubiquitin-protein ligase HECTD1 [Paratrimastix pyriformis]
MTGVTDQVYPSRLLQRLVERVQCRCPNRALGCPDLLGVLVVGRHLATECEWREEECDRCHERVRRTEMGHHQDTTCPGKMLVLHHFWMLSVVQMACGCADVGCEARFPQADLPAHERDCTVAHASLLRQRLTSTTAELAQTRQELAAVTADFAQNREELAATKAELVGTRERLGGELTATKGELAMTQEELATTRHDLSVARAYLDQVPPAPPSTALRFRVFLPPPAPSELQARWNGALGHVSLSWRPQEPEAAAAIALPPYPAVPPVRYRVSVTLRKGEGQPATSVLYTGPDLSRTYEFPADAPAGSEARFTVVAIRGLVESRPSAAATCTRPRPIVFTYDHDMDDRGLFYYIGTQGNTQPWRNPAEAGWVTVSRSSPEGGRGRASDALGRKACISWTPSHPNAWWQVDLGAGRLFTPTRYTLRHCDAADNVNYRLQSWRLEGSLEGAVWETLDEHAKVFDILARPARPDATATFMVGHPTDPFPRFRAFAARYFRVLMTGPSQNGAEHLMLAGFEMYGTLDIDPRHHA